MGLGAWLFASVYDRMLAGVEKAGLHDRRAELLTTARGRVLEIGAGTGANVPLYGPDVATLTLVEPEAPMARRLARRVRQESRTAAIVRAAAERLPFADACFDTIVSTLVLCTVKNQQGALAELERVLKPGGRLLFIEHVRSEEPRVAVWQDRLNGINKVIGRGCNCNRPTLDAIRAAGFAIASVDRGSLPKAPRFLRPLIVGAAERGERR